MYHNTCCFTGHRPQSLPFGSNENHPLCLKLKEILRSEIERLICEKGVKHFITGMAIGVDLIAAQIVLDLKAKHPDITLESAIPHEGQATKWTQAQRETYFKIASQCHKETMICRRYEPNCYHSRNQYMVDQSQYVIAVWNGRPSGTGVTVLYARQLGRCLSIIDSKTFHIVRENQ